MIILKPIKPNRKYDTFYELLDLWEKEGLCEIKLHDGDFVWIGHKGHILLYDEPIVNPKIYTIGFDAGLFGNEVPKHIKACPWIFWGRKPKQLEDKFNEVYKSYNERDIESIFVGRVENRVQLNRRTNYDWSKYIELFEMPIFSKYKYTQGEYLDLLTRSKFGLCLPGFGFKCNREIEYLACGVVPLIAPHVNLDYYNGLIENVHYLKVNTPADIPNVIKNIDENKWSEMSLAGREWYDSNCTIVNSFKTTVGILEEEFNIKMEDEESK